MKKWLFAILCILLIVLNVAFIIFMRQMANELYTLLLGLHYVEYLIWSSVFAIVTTIITLCLSTQVAQDVALVMPAHGLGCRVITKIAFFGISCIVTLAVGFVFVKYLPKYTRPSAYAAVEANPKFSVTDDFFNGNYGFTIEANPFVEKGYSFNCITTDEKPCFVNFNPVGSYEYTYTNDFSMQTASFMINDHGVGFSSDDTVCFHLQIIKVREEYDREDRISHNSDYKKMEQQQLLALKDIDEQVMSEEFQQIVQTYLKYYDTMRSERMPPSSELKISLSISGVDVATYQNGSIVLK